MDVRLATARSRAQTTAVGVAKGEVGSPLAGGRLEGWEVPWDFVERQGFTGELGQTVAVPGEGNVVLLVGVGARPDDGGLAEGALRSAAAVATRSSSRSKDLLLDLAPASPAEVQAVAEGVLLGSYRYQAYRTSPQPTALGRIAVAVAPDAEGSAATLRAGLAAGLRRAEATNLVRDLVNEPGGMLTAVEFAARAKAEGAANGLKVTVRDEAALRRMGFGGLLAVNRGSVEPARFVELAYEPRRATRSTPTVALVGKGVTFDSGGLSIKTNAGMASMKDDMAGGAVVLAALAACRDLGVPVRVRGYIPLTDNMLGGDATRVGDVITHYGGSTTEVLNTDAEGRLILADALAWATAERRGNTRPDAIIDLATLTGACMVALGLRTAGLFANDDELADRLLDAADTAGERLWRLPLVDAERKGIDSKIADRKNVGGAYGGAITAGLFLRDFVPAGVPWAHLDIAGPAFTDGPDELEVPTGGTGYGVRTLLSLLERWPG
jgi:leucyl aminopeptidase